MADVPEPPAPASSGGGHAERFGFLTRKLGPMPVWVWAVLLVAGYYAYTHYGPGKKNTAANTQQIYGYDGNGNPIYQPYYGLDQNGQPIFTPPNETISINQSGGPDTTTTTTTTGGGTKPKQPPPKGHASKAPNPSTYTVKKGQTLDQIAAMFHLTPDQLADANVYVKGEVPGDKKVGQTLGTGAGLKTGQVLNIPKPSAPSASPTPSTSKTITKTTSKGRWQNQEQESIPVPAQVQNQTQDQAGNTITADIIPHRPLGT